jgi:hypothetical protein
MVSFLPLMWSPSGVVGSSGAFGVFDTFNDDPAHLSHLQVPMALALGEIARTMLSSAPVITPLDVLGVKVP